VTVQIKVLKANGSRDVWYLTAAKTTLVVDDLQFKDGRM
jgi:hypothetical protein